MKKYGIFNIDILIAEVYANKESEAIKKYFKHRKQNKNHTVKQIKP